MHVNECNFRGLNSVRTWLMGFFLVAAIVAVTTVATSVTAQTRPRILVLVDTSGSMAWDITGFRTNGDGSSDSWTGGRECCPGAGGSRMFIAKEAMRKMILSTGDIEFALMKFPQDYQSDISLCGAECESYQYRFNQTATGYDKLRYHIADPNDCPSQTTFDMLDPDPWLCVDFYDGNAGEIAMWMDHHEFSDGSGGHPAVGLADIAPNGSWADGTEQELRGEGITPLGEAIGGAYDLLFSWMDDDEDIDCRPYSLIVLSDGDPYIPESCGLPAIRLIWPGFLRKR